MKRLRPFLAVVVALTALTAASAAGGDTRFSKSLPAADRASLGLDQLSSDQLAVLDALIRRDVARARYVSKTPRAARFSERLTTSEQAQAGLGTLPPTALADLDARVEALITPPVTRTTLLSRSSAPGPYSVPSIKLRRDPEIHGEMSLMVAAGSGGYSAFGGALALSYYDPENKFALSVGYSEVHSKGGGYYRRHGLGYGYDYRYDDFDLRPYDPFAPWGRRW